MEYSPANMRIKKSQNMNRLPTFKVGEGSVFIQVYFKSPAADCFHALSLSELVSVTIHNLNNEWTYKDAQGECPMEETVELLYLSFEEGLTHND